MSRVGPSGAELGYRYSGKFLKTCYCEGGVGWYWGGFLLPSSVSWLGVISWPSVSHYCVYTSSTLLIKWKMEITTEWLWLYPQVETCVIYLVVIPKLAISGEKRAKGPYQWKTPTSTDKRTHKPEIVVPCFHWLAFPVPVCDETVT